MEQCKLIPNKFYRYQNKKDINNVFFKFLEINRFYIYSHGYEITNNIYEVVRSKVLTEINDLYDPDIKFLEINISEIVNYLPNDNLDKKNYLRQQKIKLLLNENR